MKRTVQFVFTGCLLSVIGATSNSCDLPLCSQGQVHCRYGQKADCTGNDCSCDPEVDNNCMTIATAQSYDKRCERYICENEAWVPKEPCAYGFDGYQCNPECNNGEVKCISNGEAVQPGIETECSLKRCNNSTWTDGKTCSHGFDGYQCNPECTNGEVKCIGGDGEPVDNNVDVSCNLYICNNNQFSEPVPCQHGYSGYQCLPECSNGEIQCLDENNQPVTYESYKSCSLKRCQDNNWPKVADKICPFGYGADTLDCIDPCVINEEHYSFLSDGKYILKCTSDNGWDIDNTCFNDFTKDQPDSSDDVVRIPAFAFSQSIRENEDLRNILKEQNLKSGKCGECSSDVSPDFCSIVVEDNKRQTIIHHCVNGQMEIKSDEAGACNNIKTECKDSYNQSIYVDTSKNRYHCGECNLECASHQTCNNGICSSDITINDCDEDGFYIFRDDARLIRAYCIGSQEDLAKIQTRYPKETNYDNAYILVNDIELENWSPIEFEGILFGNGKTITINSFKHEEESSVLNKIGLFSDINNANINNLTLVSRISDDIPETFNRINFGLLAANAANSIVRSIVVKDSNIEFSLKTTHGDKAAARLGLLLGQSTDTDILSVNITNSSLNTSRDVGSLYVGSLVGYSKDDNIQNCSAEDVTISARKYASGDMGIGGLIGTVSCDKPDLSIYKKLSVNRVSVNGLAETGGVIGYAEHCIFDAITAKNVEINSNAEENFKTDAFSVGGITGESYGISLVNGHAENVIIYGNHYLGGITGTSQGVDMDNISLRTVSVRYSGEDCDEIGGVIGYARGAFSNIKAYDINIYPYGSISGTYGGFDIGGFAGSFSGSGSHIYIENTKLDGIDEVGGFAGSFNDGNITFAHVKNHEIYGDQGVGGFVGYMMSGNISGCIAESQKIAGKGVIGGFIETVVTVGYHAVIEASQSYSHIKPESETAIVGGFVGSHFDSAMTLGNNSSLSYVDKVNDNRFAPYSLIGSNNCDTEVYPITMSQAQVVYNKQRLIDNIFNQVYKTNCEHIDPVTHSDLGDLEYLTQSDFAFLSEYDFGICAAVKETCYFMHYCGQDCVHPSCGLSLMMTEASDSPKCFKDSYSYNTFWKYKLWDEPFDPSVPSEEHVLKYQCNASEFKEVVCHDIDYSTDSCGFSINFGLLALPIYNTNPNLDKSNEAVVMLPSFCHVIDP